MLRIGGLRQEIGDALFSDTAIGDDVIKIFHQYNFVEYREIGWRAGFYVDVALVNDAGVIGRIFPGVTNQFPEFFKSTGIEAVMSFGVKVSRVVGVIFRAGHRFGFYLFLRPRQFQETDNDCYGSEHRQHRDRAC